MTKKITKKQWWMSIGIAFLLVAGLAGYMYTQNLTEPKDIGPKLEYIGQVNNGCTWWQGILSLGFCGDRESNHSYYYATDMDESEIISYFKNATNIYLLPGRDSNAYNFEKDGEFAIANFYPAVEVNSSLAKTQKKYIFEISADGYEVVKNSY